MFKRWKIRLGNWWRLFSEWVSPAINYFVTVCLGAAGILFARTFPSSDINDFVPAMLIGSMFFFLIGLLLKIFASRENAS